MTMMESSYQNKIMENTIKGINREGTMPQAGIDPPVQKHASYEASALPQSHHGWTTPILKPV